MPVPKHHYLHSRNGRFSDGTDHSALDLDAILDHIAASGRKRLVLHFHGGLVPKASGLEIAERLFPVYETAAYPLFFVWESGAWETVRNNLADIARERPFRAIVRKLLEYTLKKVGLEDGTRSIAGGQVSRHEVKDRLDDWFDAPQAHSVPYSEAHPALDRLATRSVALGMDVDGQDQAEIFNDISQDFDFQDAMDTLPATTGTSRAAAGAGGIEPTRMDPGALGELTGATPGGGAGRGVSLLLAARQLARLLAAVVRRFADGRDHGFYVTVVEEVLRGLYADAVGKALFWNQMKQDTADAFGGDAQRDAGSALLTRLMQRIGNGLALEKIFLVGHSTGGIYVSHLLDAVASQGFPPHVRFDIVLLAPANDYASFARMLDRHAGRIASLRMFGLQDAVERADALLGDTALRAIYPYSLLYFVSGILENEADAPIVGMQRFHADAVRFDEEEFPAVARVRAWLAREADRLVWSVADDGDGRRCRSIRHGDFDNDPVMLQSLGWMVSH